jgi:hypothetical protein
MRHRALTRLIATASAVTASLIAPLHAQSPSARTATLVWQVDGTESGDPFGDLRDFVLLPNGHVWALDFRDQVIRRYDGTGRSLPTVGRKGSGPGELRNANGLVVAPDGAVWANDPANSRFTIFTSAGVYQRALTVPISGYGYRWGAWFDRSGELVELALGREARYRRITQAGAVAGGWAYPECPSGAAQPLVFRAETPGKGEMTGSYPFTTGGGVVADRRGHFWCAAARGTRVARLAYGSRDTLARTAIEFPSLPVPAAERDDAIRQVETRLARYSTTTFDRRKVPTTRPGIAALFVDLDGRLWVAHPQAESAMSSTFTVCDEKGAVLFRVTFPARVNSYLPLLARGDDVIVAGTDADDVVSLRKYRMR